MLSRSLQGSRGTTRKTCSFWALRVAVQMQQRQQPKCDTSCSACRFWFFTCGTTREPEPQLRVREAEHTHSPRGAQPSPDSTAQSMVPDTSRAGSKWWQMGRRPGAAQATRTTASPVPMSWMKEPWPGKVTDLGQEAGRAWVRGQCPGAHHCPPSRALPLEQGEGSRSAPSHTCAGRRGSP